MGPESASSNGATERSPLLDKIADRPAPSDENREERGERNEQPVENKPLTTSQLLRVMSGVYIGAFLASLDSTLIATLATPISISFDSLTLLSWLASAYFIANAVSQPLVGKLTDIYGRKSGMIVCNVLFGIGNLICAVAPSERVMILGRIVAGIGGGGIGPIATFVASDLVPLRQRGLWQGFTNICFGIGSALGGPLGGSIYDKVGWRWAFYLQLLPTIVAIILVALFMNVKSSTRAMPDDQPKHKRIDFIGALLLVSTLVLLLTGLNSGGNVVPWTHPLVLITLPLSVVLLGLFLYVEANVEEPIIPINLLCHRTVLFACLANWFVTAARFGLLFYAPVFFFVQGFSVTQIGTLLLPESLAIGFASIGCGVIMRSSARYYVLGASAGAILLVGMGIPMSFSLRTPSWMPFFCFFLVGIGYSGVLSVTLIALIAAVDHKEQVRVDTMSYQRKPNN